MLMRNMRSYKNLSITVVFSFMILAGYLIYSDSKIYNNYKTVKTFPDNVLGIDKENGEGSIEKIKNAINVNKIEADYYTYNQINLKLREYGDRLWLTLKTVPEGEKSMFIHAASGGVLGMKEVRVTYCDESRKSLLGNEAVIEKSFYEALGKPDMPFEFSTEYINYNGKADCFVMTVVGIFDCDGMYELKYDDDLGWSGEAYVYICEEGLDIGNFDERYSTRSGIIIVSEYLEQVEEIVNRYIDTACFTAYKNYMEEADVKRKNASDKAIISTMLVMILGINLYGCFANVISERKYEIGVKRALGASKFNIVVQFMAESFVLLAADIFIAIDMVLVLFSGYKLYRYIKQSEMWIIYVSGYSAAIFFVCAIGITVFLSIILSYKATQVEIAEELKAE